MGEEITNSVGIYFDYHPPVITNTVLNTIAWSTTDTSNNDTSTGIFNHNTIRDLLIYSNPNDGNILFLETINLPLNSIQIRDVRGRLIKHFDLDKEDKS